MGVAGRALGGRTGAVGGRGGKWSAAVPGRTELVELHQLCGAAWGIQPVYAVLAAWSFYGGRSLYQVAGLCAGRLCGISFPVARAAACPVLAVGVLFRFWCAGFWLAASGRGQRSCLVVGGRAGRTV